MGLLEKCLDFLPTRRAVSDIEEDLSWEEEFTPKRVHHKKSVVVLRRRLREQQLFPKKEVGSLYMR